jgi:hypothetical protein
MKLCVLLYHSLNQWRNEANIHFETIRKTRSYVSNYDRTTREELELHCLAGYKRGERQRFTGTTVYREWLNIFLIGCLAIIGDDRRPDQVMPIEVILEVQATLERDLFNSQTVDQMIRVYVQAVFIICGFCAGLRGEELTMMSLDAMAKHYKKDQPVEGSLENVFLALRGRVKGEHSEDACHLIPIAATTETGLERRFWVGRMIEAYLME